ncbi:hypothetical protein HNY73_009700 [Argiope bruennichi]|uniref:Uncharacterized protein n=1 Tax=Argiope bruennichi TaxID=94029 RepID=A0A8T0FFF7_ARGBR|nr:hypothetical protein HNY73_009700 [Argiope bruennichi]
MRRRIRRENLSISIGICPALRNMEIVDTTALPEINETSMTVTAVFSVKYISDEVKPDMQTKKFTVHTRKDAVDNVASIISNVEMIRHLFFNISVITIELNAFDGHFSSSEYNCCNNPQQR